MQKVPLCSVHQAPSYEPNFTLLARILPMLAYLSMLFILEMGCTAKSTGQGKDKQHNSISQLGENHASRVKSDSFYGYKWMICQIVITLAAANVSSRSFIICICLHAFSMGHFPHWFPCVCCTQSLLEFMYMIENQRKYAKKLH